MRRPRGRVVGGPAGRTADAATGGASGRHRQRAAPYPPRAVAERSLSGTDRP
ncbi:hypothetical protein [Streptomyces luteireticuli]|uniref:hypothetical protein n=1 Tax=Streptomyces luteireticuli TaxID=173858 RepID=UPI0031D64CD1